MEGDRLIAFSLTLSLSFRGAREAMQIDCTSIAIVLMDHSYQGTAGRKSQ